MAREPFVIDKNEWQRMFDKFCNEVYAKNVNLFLISFFVKLKMARRKMLK